MYQFTVALHSFHCNNKALVVKKIGKITAKAVSNCLFIDFKCTFRLVLCAL